MFDLVRQYSDKPIIFVGTSHELISLLPFKPSKGTWFRHKNCYFIDLEESYSIDDLSASLAVAQIQDAILTYELKLGHSSDLNTIYIHGNNNQLVGTIDYESSKVEIINHKFDEELFKPFEYLLSLYQQMPETTDQSIKQLLEILPVNELVTY